jgi:opine dehydrogenase
MPGAPQSFSPLANATDDMALALAHARLVLVTVPAFAHADIARECAPFLQDGQTLLLLPGRTGGALEFRRELQRAGCKAQVLLGEGNTLPLAARCVDPATAVVYGVKDGIHAAALPGNRTGELIGAWRAVLPMLSPARSVLHTGLANVGAILHPTITLLNAHRIARGELFDFYIEGVTLRVAAALEFADADRLRIADAFGISVPSLQEWIASAYGHRGNDMMAAVGGNPAYVGIKAPVTLQHRYLLEDVPTGLIPLLELAKAASVAVPTLKGLVELARSTLRDKKWGRERTLAALGLAGFGAKGMRNFIERGVDQTAQPAKSVAFSKLGARQELAV